MNKNIIWILVRPVGSPSESIAGELAASSYAVRADKGDLTTNFELHHILLHVVGSLPLLIAMAVESPNLFSILV